MTKNRILVPTLVSPESIDGDRITVNAGEEFTIKFRIKCRGLAPMLAESSPGDNCGGIEIYFKRWEAVVGPIFGVIYRMLGEAVNGISEVHSVRVDEFVAPNTVTVSLTDTIDDPGIYFYRFDARDIETGDNVGSWRYSDDAKYIGITGTAVARFPLEAV